MMRLRCSSRCRVSARCWPPNVVIMITVYTDAPMDSERLGPGFERLCTVHADLTEPWKVAPVQVGVFGKQYKEVEVCRYRLRSSQPLDYVWQFTICLAFGDTELRARVRWEEKVRPTNLVRNHAY
jgi:hypothetical protein